MTDISLQITSLVAELNTSSRALVSELIAHELPLPNLIYSEGPTVQQGSSQIERLFRAFTKAFENCFVSPETHVIVEKELEAFTGQGAYPNHYIEYLGFQQSSTNGEVTNIHLRIVRVKHTYQIHPNMVKIFLDHDDLMKEKSIQEEIREMGLKEMDKSREILKTFEETRGRPAI